MKCPGCEAEMELNSTGRAYKHKDTAAAKAKGCKIPFIPKLREKGAAKNDTEEAARTTSQKNNGGKGESEQRGGGYREAVRRSTSKRGKSGKRSGKQRAQHDSEERGEQQPRTAAAVKPAVPRGRWFDSVTKDIFGGE